jgi:hypothetical protein
MGSLVVSCLARRDIRSFPHQLSSLFIAGGRPLPTFDSLQAHQRWDPHPILMSILLQHYKQLDSIQKQLKKTNKGLL